MCMFVEDFGFVIIIIIISVAFVLTLLFIFYFFGSSLIVGRLRWLCCGGGVACYVECTNEVKKW